MNEDQLRALVRDAVARHLDAQARSSPHPSPALVAASPLVLRDLSGARFALPDSPDGVCLIEPAVACTHCGFCKSYGH